MEAITELSSQAVQEYEELREDCEKYKMECKRIVKERDEAMRKLKEFQRVSHMVIEEVSAIQESLEIEKSCRQSAEVLASKLHRQNRSLKRKSMQLLAHLGPEVIANISLEDEDENMEGENNRDSALCSSGHCQKVITELQGKLETSLEVKTQMAIELEVLREALRETREALLKEKHNNTTLIAEIGQQKKLLEKYGRVSLLAVEEYEALQGSLLLEKDLRVEAESFAREMLVEQKKLNRQSQILLKNAAPDEALQQALLEVARLTQALEKSKLKSQQQAAQDRPPTLEQKEVSSLRRQIQLLEEEKKEWEQRNLQAEEQAKDLRFRVEELQKQLQTAVNPIPAVAPPPPPPPPPLPPPAQATSSPLSSLLFLLRKKKQTNNEIPLVVQNSSGMEQEVKVPDIRQQAVEEMMQRIKKGVQLRPVRQGPRSSWQPKAPTLPSDSALRELKGMLDTFRRASPIPGTAGIRVGTTQTELEKALQRRRRVVDCTQENRESAPSSHLPQETSAQVEKENEQKEIFCGEKTPAPQV